MVPSFNPATNAPTNATITWTNSAVWPSAWSVLYHSQDFRVWTPIWSNKEAMQVSVQVVDGNSNDFFRAANEIPGIGF
ncbi:MAG: hypothetical protein KGL39_50595 [Patescibacteria group bacterium]|nr:hypothetical protein [Patescibacteria group bacterium]